MMELSDNRRAELESLLGALAVPASRLDLVDQALTHRSYAFENAPASDNERLEFLGDSVLGFVIADYFYRRYPDADEGALSKRKARVVSRTLLGAVARELDLGRHVLLGRGEEHGGGRRRATLLGSVLEALIGAIYLADGFEAAAAFIRRQLLDRLVSRLEEEETWDFKSMFQELVQKRFQTTPRYETVSVSGPDHDRIFTVRALVNDAAYGEASAPRKKTAENQAAKLALEALEGGASES